MSEKRLYLYPLLQRGNRLNNCGQTSKRSSSLCRTNWLSIFQVPNYRNYISSVDDIIKKNENSNLTHFNFSSSFTKAKLRQLKRNLEQNAKHLATGQSNYLIRELTASFLSNEILKLELKPSAIDWEKAKQRNRWRPPLSILRDILLQFF